MGDRASVAFRSTHDKWQYAPASGQTTVWRQPGPGAAPLVVIPQGLYRSKWTWI